MLVLNLSVHPPHFEKTLWAIKLNKPSKIMSYLVELEDMARYAGLLLTSAEGFGLQLGAFFAIHKKPKNLKIVKNGKKTKKKQKKLKYGKIEKIAIKSL